MKVSDEAISEFRRLYKEEYGEEISESEAGEMTFRLIALYELLAKHKPEEASAAPTPPNGRREEPPTVGFLK